MQVEFHGAAGEVTGSMHLVHAAGRRVLLDCGLLQGRRELEARNADPFPFEPASLDALVLSHAHIDHIGRVPLMVARGFDGPIWLHGATADLLPVMLEDAASLAESEAQRANRHRDPEQPPMPPLFTRRDVARVLPLLRPLDYDVRTTILPGVDIAHDKVWYTVVYRGLLSVIPGGWYPVVGGVVGESAHIGTPDDLAGAIDLTRSWHVFATADLWIGAVVGVAFIAAAIRLRRWRDEG